MVALPDPESRPCLSADEAFAQLGIDRTTGYRAIRDGTFPVPVIRVGRLIRVPTAALRRALSLNGSGEGSTLEYDDDTDPRRALSAESMASGGERSARPLSAPRNPTVGLRQSREGGRP